MSANSDGGGNCLVARAMPCAIPVEADRLAEQLNNLSVNVDESSKKVSSRSNGRCSDRVTPADFVALQSIRSSALARKTNTTSKFGRAGAALFADLLNTDNKKASQDESDANKEETVPAKTAEDDKSPENSELLPRGPVRSARAPVHHHPYSLTGYGAAPQSNIEDYTYSSNMGSYECGNSWTDSPDVVGYVSSSSTPDTVNSDGGYSSSSPPRHSPFTDHHNMTTTELNRLLNASELPDALSDFILKYSRRYSASSSDPDHDVRAPSSRKSSTSEASSGGSPKRRPASADGGAAADSGCDSPMSAGSAPQRSPAAPRGGRSAPGTPPYHQTNGGVVFRAIAPRTEGTRSAKERLRSLISDADMDDAFAWTCKCVQYFPGALCYQDVDRDSLLHIVTLHMDLAKIYALVEQMLKSEFPPCQKPFDMPNRFHETPLFLAVEKRCVEVVAYLLEAGAYPNGHTMRPERDAPLHYAAARGMTEIVQALCANATTDVNMANGMGLTPLLCAVKNHGVIEEDSQCLINNKPTIRALLKATADATIPDATNGKTVVHYAVERSDPELIEVNRRPPAFTTLLQIFKTHLDEQSMTTLVNKPDFNGERAIDTVRATADDDQLRTNLFMTLLACGAYQHP